MTHFTHSAFEGCLEIIRDKGHYPFNRVLLAYITIIRLKRTGGLLPGQLWKANKLLKEVQA